MRRPFECFSLLALAATTQLQSSASAFVHPSVVKSGRATTTSTCSGRLPLHRQYVTKQPLDDLTALMDEDDDNDDNDYNSIGEASFYNVDYMDDDEQELDDTDIPTTTTVFNRDEDEMLTELEDRFYIDERGQRRQVEKCILVGVEDLSAKRKLQKARRQAGQEMPYDRPNVVPDEEMLFTLQESLGEMRELIKTAGMDCVGEITQRLQEVNPRTYVGSGKVLEAQELLEQHGACTIVFDAELTPGQQKALENSFNKKIIQNDFLGADGEEGEIKVIDRTALILDIFAQHAKTREGKLQVDLALHEYRKPRLTRMWTHLERQSGAGGVGLRGPGESQLEIDKRLIRDRIIVLKSKIDDVQKQRAMHRQGRARTGLPILSLVGYTNAGKSTLLNYLTRAGVMAESMLFATLDPTTRKVQLPGLKTHPSVMLTDTVGFVQKLPTQLVAAFRATLEEVQEADVLIHVIDVSNPTWEKQERAVLDVLASMNALDKPVVRVLNKIDLLDAESAEYLQYEAAYADLTVAVSSLLGDGVTDFVSVVEEALQELMVPIEVEIPYSKGDELSAVHEQGHVEVVDYRPNGTYVMARVPRSIANRLEQYSLIPKEQQQQSNSSPNGTDDDEEIDWVALGRGRHSERDK
ncbi:GTPase HflX [Seminavis robusta]|uniref:GTPase HflX n=1 Tax=Seminavis robusta TaxID=568900 RepID=A0A9N8DL09_9STRA|nr:GTPase HflX [Seminavis robusta]|eukprot:Sro140_g065500.1 GTPase HflX (637) ;mRNA; f:63932-66015